MRRDQPTLAELSADGELRDVIIEHAYRGLRVQLCLRAVLVLFALVAAVAVPPAAHRASLYVVVAVYATFALATGAWLLADGVRGLRLSWLALFGDVVALVLLTLIAGESDVDSWTADLVINGFFVVPVLAATQLRPGICAAVIVPTEAAYLGASLATRAANTEPLGSVLVRSLALAAVCAGSVALSYIQRSRVVTIGGLVGDRAQLLSDLLVIERQERQRLSERLHDGALQYVLAARMDLDDVRDSTDPGAVDRIDAALAQTSSLLRTTVGELHPAVLEQAGLPAALRQLAATAAERGAFAATVDDAGWPPGLRTSADPMLFSAAQEVLANAVKHAGAENVTVALSWGDDRGRLVVQDDGRGIDPAAPEQKLRDGHIGVASHRARVNAAGGSLEFGQVAGGGTVVTVVVPAPALPARP